MELVQSPLADDELADRWETQALGGSGVSHIDHVRVAWVLHGRHGPVEAEERLVEGTRKGCDYYGVPEKFDEHLTRRWARPVSDAVADAPESESFQDFIERNPELRRGDLFGKPGEVPLADAYGVPVDGDLLDAIESAVARLAAKGRAERWPNEVLTQLDEERAWHRPTRDGLR
jgi:hypothetical protein